jgi:hypothetical protein
MLTWTFETLHRGTWMAELDLDKLIATIAGSGEAVTVVAGSIDELLISLGQAMMQVSGPASIEEQMLRLIQPWHTFYPSRPADEIAYLVVVDEELVIWVTPPYRSVEEATADIANILSAFESHEADIYMVIDCKEHGRLCYPECPFCHPEPWEDWTDDLPALWPRGIPAPATEDQEQDELLISAILAHMPSPGLSWDDNGGAVM